MDAESIFFADQFQATLRDVLQEWEIDVECGIPKEHEGVGMGFFVVSNEILSPDLIEKVMHEVVRRLGGEEIF